MADREVSGDGRATIKRLLRGAGQEITVVVPSMREPRVYGYEGKESIANALKGAGFTVLIDFWTRDTPPETGVVFCEIRGGDRKIYDALHLAHLATKIVGIADKERPDFCDRPGIEAPLEQLSHQLSLNLTAPLGHLLLKRGTFAKWHGPRIFVGQKEE